MNIKLSLLLFTVFRLVFSEHLPAQCNPSGSMSGNGFVDNSSLGLVTWSNPASASSSDNNRASAGTLVGVLATISTHYLTATGFNFSVPASASICGIEVSIEHRQTGVTAGYSVRDNAVQLLNNGSIIGNNKAQLTDWANHDQVFTYGGSTDTWGNALTPADVNSPAFGLAVSASLKAGLASAFLTAEVDYVSMTVYYDMAVPLGVEYANFSAEDKGPNGISLTWQTLSETNNSYFAVERSTDGMQFKQIRTVKGAGTTLEAMSYYAMDERPLPGQLYYRLRQVDNNGKCSYSPVREVRYNGKPAIASACANNGSILVHVYVPEDTPVDIRLMNVTGSTVRSLRQDMQSGHNEVRIWSDDLTSGIYFVKATVGASELYQKVYVVND